MQCKGIHLVVFSPCKGTLRAAQSLAGGLGGDVKEWNLTTPAAREAFCASKKTFGPEELVILAFPVYGGRIPRLGADIFAMLSGSQTPAILMVVYGNRHYDDALLEIQREAEKKGFVAVAAVAAVAEHTMARTVAASRPDAADAAKLKGIGGQLAAAVAKMPSAAGVAFTAPGEEPYRRPTHKTPYAPETTAACNQCGTCVAVCPNGAIPKDAPNTTSVDLCIICSACVGACPEKARIVTDERAAAAEKRLRENFTEPRKEAELFM